MYRLNKTFQYGQVSRSLFAQADAANTTYQKKHQQKAMANYRAFHQAAQHTVTLTSAISAHRTPNVALFTPKKTPTVSSNFNGLLGDAFMGSALLTVQDGRIAKQSQLISRVSQGIANGHTPKVFQDGTSGSYLMLGESKSEPVALFKPNDEEPYTPHNPNGMIGEVGDRSLRPSIASGQGYVRELAAFLLDHKAAAGVPTTTTAEINKSLFENQLATQPKLGSLQQWIPGTSEISDYGPSLFNVQQVQMIALLDMRILNLDRNDGNILVKKASNGDGYRLIPVDHAMAFPDSLKQLDLAFCDWCWLDWAQVKQETHPAVVEYFNSLDIDADMALLQEQASTLPQEALDLFWASHHVLKAGINEGLTLHEIGSIFARQKLSRPSAFERLCQQAIALTAPVRLASSPTSSPTEHWALSEMLKTGQESSLLFDGVASSSSMNNALFKSQLKADAETLIVSVLTART